MLTLERHDPGTFEYAFAELATLAADPRRIYEVGEVVLPEVTAPYPTLEVYSRKRFHKEKPNDSFIQEGTTYRYWQQPPKNEGDKPELISVEEMGSRRFASPARGSYRGLKPSAVAKLFTPYAQRPDQLARIVGYVSEFAEENPTSGLVAATHDTVVKSMQFVSDAVGFDEIVEAYRADPAAEYKRKHVGTALGKLLIGNQIGSHKKQAVEQMDKGVLIKTIQAYEKAGLLDYNGFWVEFGVVAAGAAKVPALLPMLYDKLQAQEDKTPFEKPPSAPMYITEVLQTALDDPSRRRDRVREIMVNTRSIQLMPGATISARSIIEEANTVAHIYNRVVNDESLMLPMLDPHNAAHLSDAFLRLMATTRRNDLPIAQRIAQFEQDTLHAEVVALVTQSVRGKAVRMGDLLLQFPGVSSVQLTGLKRLIEELGLSLPEALRRSFKDQK